MSFWRTFGFPNVTPIDTILDRPSFTLEELFDEDEMLTECKAQNKRLFDFLCEPASLAKLFQYITELPDDLSDERLRYKYPYLACEILSLDSWNICDLLFGPNRDLLTVLWSFFASEGPIDSLLCSYVTRVCGVLLQRSVAETLDFLKTQPEIVAQLVSHFETPTVVELVLKMIALEETTEGITKWLSDNGFVTQCFEKLNQDLSPTLHENISQIFESLLEQTPINRACPLIASLLEGSGLELLVAALKAQRKSTFLAGVSIMTKLLERFTKDESALDDTAIEALPPAIQQTLSCLDALVVRLRIHESFNTAASGSDGASSSSSSSSSSSAFDSAVPITNDQILYVELTPGKKTPPVGPERLKILDLLSCLIRLRETRVDALLIEKEVFQASFQLFFAYPWNNFLHSNVRNLVSDVFSGTNLDTKMAILDKCHFLDSIIDAATENAEITAPVGISSGRGFMGFVIQMSNGINQSCESDGTLSAFLANHERWKEYCQNLLETSNGIERTMLGGPRVAEPRSDSSSDDTPYSGGTNSELVSVFKQYLSTHQFNGNYPPSFGELNDEEDEYDDNDVPADPDAQQELVLDRAFEQDATPYAANLSNYYDIHSGEGSSSEEGQPDGDFEEFDDSEEDHK